ncbi:Beta-adaptin-like protein C [Aduncisulcus paluster]|uniref:AP complex subunit beta n=1 Tax=Aduncisulcus paluster TaxID=2918883 RepID=A0ABQ5KRU1_9EUKA|nr:Beta-adaptin-like protein C [Aduncisulcus paluster]
MFQSSKRGEVVELGEELQSASNVSQRRSVVKRIIAAMTVGKDVSPLFTEVLKCIQTKDLELKKLVYLYIISYARTHPEASILAVNTFVKDATDPDNPLVRALAIRTMGCLRVEAITEYICEPLSASFKDEDAYVRKAAALAVAKLYDLDPELCHDQGFVRSLREMLLDQNPAVVGNACAALGDIAKMSSKKGIPGMNDEIANHLLAALPDANEWAQAYILGALANYNPTEGKEPTVGTEDTMLALERVFPRLQHANPAVSTAAIRVIVNFVRFIQDAEKRESVLQRLAPPLVTLMSGPCEIQYITLRNIPLLLRLSPNLLSSPTRVRAFFCKYTDPLYVKLEKLDVLVQLATPETIGNILAELKECAHEVDVEFARKSVRSIGKLALRMPTKLVPACVKELLSLIETGVNYVVQEIVVVMRDIFRVYPGKYESVIGKLCSHIESFDEPNARASLAWIVGEYADRIDNSTEIMEWYSDTFVDESPIVQLAVLTAVVKLFINVRDEDSMAVTHTVLKKATEEVDDPDVRDRAYLYWRLLAASPDEAKDIVLATKPPISVDDTLVDMDLVKRLLPYVGSLASVLRRPPEALTGVGKKIGEGLEDEEEDYLDEEEKVEEEGEEEGEMEEPAKESADEGDGDMLDDLLEDLGVSYDTKPKQPTHKPEQPPTITPKAEPKAGDDDLLSSLGFQASPSPSGHVDVGLTSLEYDCRLTKPVPLTQSQGLSIAASFTKMSGKPVVVFIVKNDKQSSVSGLAIQFNKNAFGLGAEKPILSIPGGSIAPGTTSQVRCVLVRNSNPSKPATPQALMQMQVALKTPSSDQLIFSFNLPAHLVLSVYGVPVSDFEEMWKAMASAERTVATPFPPNISPVSVLSISARFTGSGLSKITDRKVADVSSALFSTHFPLGATKVPCLVRVDVNETQKKIKVVVRSRSAVVVPHLMGTIGLLLKA